MTVGTGSLKEGGDKSDALKLKGRERRRGRGKIRALRSDLTINRCSTVVPGCQRNSHS